MSKKHYVEIFLPGERIGTFCIEDNQEKSSCVKTKDAVYLNVPLDFAIACVKQAGYKIFKEV